MEHVCKFELFSIGRQEEGWWMVREEVVGGGGEGGDWGE